jgi:hypothetical protein
MTGELESVLGEDANSWLLLLSVVVLLVGVPSSFLFARLMRDGILTFKRGW